MKKSEHAIDKELQKEVAARLKALRKKRKLTQEVLAGLADLAVRHYRRIESGETNTSIGTLSALAHALNVDISEFFKKNSP